MSIRPLRPDQQEVVIATLEDATDLSPELGPDAAIAKAAQQNGLPEKLLGYTVNAYNTGRSLTNIKSGRTREERAADVPLASLEGVLRCLHPDAPVQKAAISSDYYQKPSWLLQEAASTVKKASNRRPYVETVVPDDKIVASVRDIQETVKRARSELNQEFYIYKRAQQAIQHYLDNQNHMRLQDLLEQSRTAFGDMAKIVLEPLSDPLTGYKKASWSYLVRVNKAPFTLVKAAIDQLNKLHELGLKCGQQEQELVEMIKDARQQVGPNVFLDSLARSLELRTSPAHEPEEVVTPVNKKAFGAGKYLLNEILNAPKEFSESISRAKPSTPVKAPEAKAPNEIAGAKAPKPPASLLGPAKHEEINALQKSVAVNSLLASDPDLQGYDQNAIARAFNEIQMAYPRVASQPATLRPFLQRHLTAVGLDEFALKNLADQEALLAKSQMPSRETA